MLPKDKLKFLIPGVAVLLVGTIVVVLLVKVSGNDSPTSTDKQTKEELKVPVDPCVNLLEEFVKSREDGVDEETLKTLYAKGSAQCPADFPLPQDELPNVEDVRAQLVKKQKEKKQSVNNTGMPEQGDASGVTAQTFGSKGSNSSADPSTPATVPLAKNNTTGIKNNTVLTTDKPKVESVNDTINQQLQVPVPTANQPSSNADTTGNQPTALNTPGNPETPPIVNTSTTGQQTSEIQNTTGTQPNGNPGSPPIVSSSSPGPQPSGTLNTSGPQPSGSPNDPGAQPSGTQTSTEPQPDGNQSITEPQPSGTPNDPGKQPNGSSNPTEPQPNAPNPNPQGTNINNSAPAPTPEELKRLELKEKLTAAKNECMAMLKGIEDKGSAAEMLSSFTEEQKKRIYNLKSDGKIPRNSTSNQLVMDLWYGKMLKHMKAGNDKEAQKAYNTYVEVARASGEKVEDAVVTQRDDYNFWRTIENDNWAEAKTLLDKPLFLPSFIREAMKKNPEKLKLLKELNDAQMDALWDYCKWNVELDDCLVQYEATGEERDMSINKSKYNNTVDKMRSFSEDIHKDFDFAVPDLIEKKSHMQELDEKLTNKTPEFEKLRKDRNLGMSLIAEAVYSLEKPEDQIELLQTLRKLKGRCTVDAYLVDLLLSSAKKEPVGGIIKEYLTYADFNKDEHMSVISEAMAKMPISGWSLLEQACIDFWKQFVSLSQTLKSKLQYIAKRISPLDIETLGSNLSEFNLGDKGTSLVEQCVNCITIKNREEPSEKNEAAQVYAQAYLKLYKTVNGAGMDTLYTDKPIPKFFKDVDSQTLADLILSKVKLDNWRNKKLIKLVNSNIIAEVDKRFEIVGEQVPEDWEHFVHPLHIASCNLPDGTTLTEAHLDVLVLNNLRDFFDRYLICEWNPVPVTQHVTLEEVVSSFEAFNANKLANGKNVDQALKDEFIGKAETYQRMRKQMLFDELKKIPR